MTVDFDVLPRLLQELCEGVCGQYCVEVFKHTLPNGGCLWECRRLLRGEPGDGANGTRCQVDHAMILGESMAIAAPGLVLALIGGVLWIGALRALHRTEEERDRLWDEHHGPTNPRPIGEWR